WLRFSATGNHFRLLSKHIRLILLLLMKFFGFLHSTAKYFRLRKRPQKSVIYIIFQKGLI
ncbi:MAG TPA: hypothetical protein DIV41_06685, partial [Ruminococcaceae bacterium]|nr:hypothetical protein [Oscillospiraceae bacterium]